MGKLRNDQSERGEGVTLRIRVTPRAPNDEISQIMEDGTIKIRLTAPPVEGKANAALVKFLAEILRVPGGSIEILSGESSRNKHIRVIGMKAEVAQQLLREASVKLV
jgi:hypothetical protein